MRVMIVQNPLLEAQSARVNASNRERWHANREVLVKAVRACGHSVAHADAGEGLREALRKQNPDLVFLISFRADPADTICMAQAFFEREGIPFTGSSLLACRTARDKYRAKAKFFENGLSTAKFSLIPIHTEPIKKPDGLEFPLFIKPISAGASQGIHDDNPARDAAAFERIVRESLAEAEQPLLVEEFVGGREFTVGILGNDPPQVLPIREFVDMGAVGKPLSFRSFSGKADKEHGEPVVCPASLSEQECEQIGALALQAYRAVGCADYARVDIRLDAAGQPKILEINVHPSLLPASSFPQMAAVQGMAYEEVIDTIIRAAIARIC